MDNRHTSACQKSKDQTRRQSCCLRINTKTKLYAKDMIIKAAREDFKLMALSSMDFTILFVVVVARMEVLAVPSGL
jgi:hypothetical protein